MCEDAYIELGDIASNEEASSCSQVQGRRVVGMEGNLR
jgi:hypothetical protein